MCSLKPRASRGLALVTQIFVVVCAFIKPKTGQTQASESNPSDLFPMQRNNTEEVRRERTSTKRSRFDDSSHDHVNKRDGRFIGRDYQSNPRREDTEASEGHIRERRGYRMENQRRGDFGSPCGN